MYSMERRKKRRKKRGGEEREKGKERKGIQQCSKTLAPTLPTIPAFPLEKILGQLSFQSLFSILKEGGFLLRVGRGQDKLIDLIRCVRGRDRNGNKRSKGPCRLEGRMGNSCMNKDWNSIFLEGGIWVSIFINF